MAFSVKALREIFAFPGEPEDRQVIVLLEDASSQFSAQIGRFKLSSTLLGDDLAITASMPDGYFVTGADPRVIHAPPWYEGGFIVAATDFHNKTVLIKDAEDEVTLGLFNTDNGSWYYLDGEKIEGVWPQWTPIPVSETSRSDNRSH